MAITEDRIRAEAIAEVIEAPAVEAPEVNETLSSAQRLRTLWLSMARPISTGWAVTIAGTWVAFWVGVFALEPAASATRASLPTWYVVLEAVLTPAILGVVLAGTTAVLLHRRAALGLSLVASVLAVASTAMCPVSSHHNPGLWTAGQFTLCAGMVAISVAGLRRT